MRQRLGLAQALIGEPRLMLLDEPTTGLDPTLRHTFYNIVTDLRQAGCAILLSSHALAELEQHVDRVAILEHGRLVACGRTGELRHAAGLPTRIRVRLPGEPPIAALQRLGASRTGERSMEIQVVNGGKVEMLGALAALQPMLEDIEVLPPSLDEVYARLRTGVVP